MISLTKNGVLKITHYHLSRELDSTFDVKTDLMIVSNLNAISKNNNDYVRLEKTYVLDLSLYSSVEEIKTSMNSTIRNSINFCINDGVVVEYYEKNLSTNILKDFLKTLKEMYKQKHLASKIVSIKTLIKYSNQDNLVVSRVMHDGLPISYHVYLKDGFECVLWFSCSLFRNAGSSSEKNFVGKCNRYHHFEDICYFYNKNYSSYDWGGVSSFDEPNGIDAFKFSFPGKKVTKYELIRPFTWKGRLYARIKGLNRNDPSR